MSLEREVPTATQNVLVNGIQLHYVTWGEFTVPERTVVLVHGLTANSQTWNALGPALAAAGWHALAVDLRGRGLSEKPPHGYGVPFHVNDLLSLGDALGLEHIHIVGHSLGARIALYLAALYPQRTGSVVLIDAGGEMPADVMDAIGGSISRVGTLYPSLDAFLEPQRSSSLYQWNAYWEQYYRYDAEIRPDGSVTSRMPLAALEEEGIVNAFINFAAMPEHVKAPTLILRATVGTLAPDRGFVLAAEEAQRMQRLIPGSRLIEVPDANHYTIALAPAVLREVPAFLNSQR